MIASMAYSTWKRRPSGEKVCRRTGWGWTRVGRQDSAQLVPTESSVQAGALGLTLIPRSYSDRLSSHQDWLATASQARAGPVPRAGGGQAELTSRTLWRWLDQEGGSKAVDKLWGQVMDPVWLETSSEESSSSSGPSSALAAGLNRIGLKSGLTLGDCPEWLRRAGLCLCSVRKDTKVSWLMLHSAVLLSTLPFARLTVRTRSSRWPPLRQRPAAQPTLTTINPTSTTTQSHYTT